MYYTSEVDYERLGQRLLAMREARGLSQTAAARKVGRTGAWVSAVERGISRTPIDVLEHYVEGLGGQLLLSLLTDDEDQALLARFSGVLPVLTPDAKATLRALVTLWEGQHAAGTGGGAINGE